jgi:hypothetical protein
MRRIAGKVTISAAAGPTPSPKPIRVCTIGISAAVGIANKVPVTARIMIARAPVAHVPST